MGLLDNFGRAISGSWDNLNNAIANPSKAKPSDIDPLTGDLTHAIAQSPIGRTIATGVAGYFGGPWGAAGAQGLLSKEAGESDNNALRNSALAYGSASLAGSGSEGNGMTGTAANAGKAADDSIVSNGVTSTAASSGGKGLLGNVGSALNSASMTKGLLSSPRQQVQPSQLPQQNNGISDALNQRLQAYQQYMQNRRL